jgi:small-conductance mechanosensitive channel
MWDMTFAGNTLTSWTVAAGVTFGLVFVLRIVASVAAARVKKFASTTATDVDDLIADLLNKTKLPFLVIVSVWGGSYALALSDRAEGTLRSFLVLGVLLQAGFWISAVVTYLLKKYRKKVESEDPGVATAMGAVGFIARLTVWTIVSLIALDTIGVDITALIAGLGVGGIAVALAVQNILGDLFASVSIILDKPFVVGDFIVLDDLRGTVEYVGLKTTRIRSQSGEQLVVSNSDLLRSRIRNFKRMTERRVAFEVGVVYGTPAEKLRQIPAVIRAAVESQSNTRFDRSHFKMFGDSSLVYETVYFMTVPDHAAYMDTQQAINLELYERFGALGVEFAYPTQTLYVKKEEGAPARS